MANGRVNLVISEKHVGTGLADAARDVKALGANVMGASKALKFLGGEFGALGALVSGGLVNLLRGGVWEIAATGIRGVIHLLGEHKRLVEAAAKAQAEADANRLAALEKYHAKLSETVKAENTAREKAVRQSATMAEALDREAKATAELARQRRIAAGESADNVNAEADANLRNIDRRAKERVANEKVTLADSGLVGAKAELENAEKEAAAMATAAKVARRKVSERIQGAWAAQNQFAARNGYRLAVGAESKFAATNMKDDATLAKLRETAASAAEKAAAAQAKVAAATQKVADMESARVVALKNAQSAYAEVAADELREVNERAKAEEEAARKVAEEKAAWLAKMDSEAHQAEQEMLLHEAKMAEEEAEKERKIKEKLEADKKKAELKRIKEAADAQTKAIDKQIAEAKKAAEEWEQRAQGARGVSFSQWSVNKTRTERAAAREARRAEERRRSAEDEIRHIEERQRFGFDRNAHTNQRLARLREFVALQDPNNNPAAKQAKQLEARREQLAKETKKSIDDILALLQNNAAL